MKREEYDAAVVVEKCIICGKDTEITTDLDVQERKHYVYGCGQLCEKCYEELHLGEEMLRSLDKKKK